MQAHLVHIEDSASHSIIMQIIAIKRLKVVDFPLHVRVVFIVVLFSSQ